MNYKKGFVLILFALLSVSLFACEEKTTSTTTSSATTTSTSTSDLSSIQQQLAQIAETIVIANSDNLVADFIVPAESGIATISWVSDQPNVISIGTSAIDDNGTLAYQATVILPNIAEGDTTVILTATFSYGSESFTKTFTLHVPALSDGSSVTTIAAGVSQGLTKYITYLGMTVVGISDGYGFFFTDGSDIMFVYDSALTSSVTVGSTYDIKGELVYYYFGPQLKDNGENEVVVTPSSLSTKEYTPTVATVSEVVSGLTIPTADGQVDYQIFHVTGKVYVDASKGDHGVYLVPESYNTSVTLNLSQTPALRVYYNSDMDVIAGFVNQVITIDFLVYNYHSTYTDWYGFFFGTAADVNAVTLSDEDKLAISVAQIENSYVVNATFALPSLSYGSISNVTISNEISAYLSWNGSTFTVTRPTTDTTGTVSMTITVGSYSQVVTTSLTMKAEAQVLETGVIISQAYGGGGNTGALYKNDFVELYNTTNSPIVLDGYYLFYASKTGTFDNYLALSGTIPAHGYFLIEMAAGSGGTQDLPTPDQVGSIAMSKDGFKLALTDSSTKPVDHASSNVVDYVGCGASNDAETAVAPAPSNTTSIIRATLADTDDNSQDFTTGDPNPRNSSTTN